MSKEERLLRIRHSAEHVLTMAMKRLYGDKITMAMGPATEEGFYFDFDSPENFTVSESSFTKIEKEMRKIIKEDLPFRKEEVSHKEARKLFKGNKYKQEWVDEIEKKGEPAIIYRTGKEFVDLCSGPHVSSTGEIGVVKLLSVAGAYWRGDENNKMLTRIYGTAFETKKELEDYLEKLEEAKKRDHRKLGKELDLFTFSELIGSGLPLYTTRGALIRLKLNEFIEELQSELEYHQVWTPQIAKAELFKTSGHYQKYKDDMFRVNSNYSDEEFYLKPMNCPQHTQIYASKGRSYRDLPIRMTDFAMLYRDEKPGELLGLARVRSFSQDDCHIFCREDQVDEEIDKALAMIKKVMKVFGFSYRYRLSTRDLKTPDKYLGDQKTWDKVEKWAEKIMKRNKIEHYDAPGEAAFYAPKMDLMATDALGREWQLSTVQIDYVMPERFGLTYIDKDGAKKNPVMIHRAVIGSPERFIMILLEHFGGNLPTWLSPVQVNVLPITEKQGDYGEKIYKKLKQAGLRVGFNDKSETLSSKIRNSQLMKIPYMIIIGNKEQKAGRIAVRTREGKDLGQMSLSKFIKKIRKNIDDKLLDL